MISAVMPTYARIDVAFERGEGAYVYTADNRRFLDFGAGIAVTALGHCHPHLVEMLKAQAEKLWHCSNLYQIPGQDRLGRRLVENTFADSVFFCNSGVEAVECGLKMIRKYHYDQGQPERYRMITFEQAFHGRTLAAIAAAGQEKLLKGFGPPVDGFDEVAFGNLNELRAAVTPQTAGIIIEPIQGEGGIRCADAEFMRGVRQVADEFGLLLFLDEVQCGMGRTGKLFAHEWAGMAPDVMAAAKGLGGGFPVGACLATERAAQALSAGSHGTTFGGNPLAMAVGNAVLDIMLAEGFLDGVQRIADTLRSGLRELVEKYPGVVTEVRGMGLLVGLKCVGENSVLSARLADNGMLAVGAGDNVLRMVPPLTIGESHVEEALAILNKCCGELAQEAE